MLSGEARSTGQGNPMTDGATRTVQWLWFAAFAALKSQLANRGDPAVTRAVLLFLCALIWLFFSAMPSHLAGNATLRVVPYSIPGCQLSVGNGCSSSIAGQPGSTAVLYGRQPGGMLKGSPTDERQNPNDINEPASDYESEAPALPLTAIPDKVIAYMPQR
jgi:hypothetical protein